MPKRTPHPESANPDDRPFFAQGVAHVRRSTNSRSFSRGLASANAQGYTNGTRNECVTLSYTPQPLSYTHTAWAQAVRVEAAARRAGGRRRRTEADGGGGGSGGAAAELHLRCVAAPAADASADVVRW